MRINGKLANEEHANSSLFLSVSHCVFDAKHLIAMMTMTMMTDWGWKRNEKCWWAKLFFHITQTNYCYHHHHSRFSRWINNKQQRGKVGQAARRITIWTMPTLLLISSPRVFNSTVAQRLVCCVLNPGIETLDFALSTVAALTNSALYDHHYGRGTL